MPTPDQYLENSIEYREQHPEEFPDEDSGIENKFDWRAIRMLCVEAIPKHKAYGMSFKEYRERRESVLDEDTTERKRLSFFIPTLPNVIAMSYALRYRCSYHRFILLTVELGLIKFQYDYHDEYSAIKRIKSNALDMAIDDIGVEKLIRLSNQSIVLGSGSGKNHPGTTKRFVPSVPEWLYSAVADTAIFLNISMSDLVFLCFCIGLLNSTPKSELNSVIEKYCIDIINGFEIQLTGCTDTINSIYSKNNQD